MPEAKTFSLSEIMMDEMSALVKAGFYASQSDVAKDALRCLFEHKPHLKISVAVELYKSGEISIGKAAEIAEMSTPDFKEELGDRGIVRYIKSSKKNIAKGLHLIRKARR